MELCESKKMAIFLIILIGVSFGAYARGVLDIQGLITTIIGEGFVAFLIYWLLIQSQDVKNVLEVLEIMKTREERIQKQERRHSMLNAAIFKLWMNVSKSRMPFQIEIPIDENINTVLLEDATDFLRSKRDKYGQILKLRKKIIESKNNYNLIAKNIETKIKEELSITYPSLEELESRKVRSQNCFIINNINHLIWYELKGRILEDNGFNWNNIILKEIQIDSLWQLEVNLRQGPLIQSTKRKDVNKEYFKQTIETLMLEISDNFVELNKLDRDSDQKLKEFKEAVYRLSIDIEMNRV